jgi:hypothetical protein
MMLGTTRAFSLQSVLLERSRFENIILYCYKTGSAIRCDSSLVCHWTPPTAGICLRHCYRHNSVRRAAKARHPASSETLKTKGAA